MISSDKGKEEMGGLVYAVALNPLDLAHLVHNGCDKGLECVLISVWRQGFEDVGEVEAWIAEHHLHQHLLESPRANPMRLVGQLLWDPLPESLEGRRHAFEEQAELGAGLEMLVGGIPKVLHPQLRQLPVQCSTVSLNEFWVTAILASSASLALTFSDKVTSRSLVTSSV